MIISLLYNNRLPVCTLAIPQSPSYTIPDTEKSKEAMPLVSQSNPRYLKNPGKRQKEAGRRNTVGIRKRREHKHHKNIKRQLPAGNILSLTGKLPFLFCFDLISDQA